jgi:hypothetical protein
LKSLGNQESPSTPIHMTFGNVIEPAMKSGSLFKGASPAGALAYKN